MFKGSDDVAMSMKVSWRGNHNELMAVVSRLEFGIDSDDAL
jgi:hypothetical protein